MCRERTGSPAFTSSYFPRSTAFMLSGLTSSGGSPRGSLLGPATKDLTLCLMADWPELLSDLTGVPYRERDRRHRKPQLSRFSTAGHVGLAATTAAVCVGLHHRPTKLELHTLPTPEQLRVKHTQTFMFPSKRPDACNAFKNY